MSDPQPSPAQASTELDESDEARWLQLRVKGQSIEEVRGRVRVRVLGRVKGQSIEESGLKLVWASLQVKGQSIKVRSTSRA